jgi:multicomponent Na+:H+ antiporter subunit C
MIYLFALTIGLTMASGTYLTLSRDTLRCLVGLSILGAAVNLLLFAAGRIHTSAPPVIPAGQTVLEHAANPLPQALVLTAIVIGLALFCFGLVLILALARVSKLEDSRHLRLSEPIPTDPIKPPLEEHAVPHAQEDQSPVSRS